MISVIIPVYNTPIKDLRRCFASVLAQTYAEWEAVIIDDGSCKEIYEELDKWSSKDSRFVVVHQENRGVSAARNSGIKKSKGEYIAFLDSDDCLKKNFMFEALAYIRKYQLDIVIGSCEIKNNKGIIVYKCASNEETPWIYETNEEKEIFLDYALTGHCKKINSELCNIFAGRIFCKLYRKDTIENIWFIPHLKMHEDSLFSYETVCAGKTIGVVENVWYEYHMNAYSVTHKKGNLSSIEDEFLFAKELYRRSQRNLNNAVYVRMVWTMKAISAILRMNKNLKNIRGKILIRMLKEEYFAEAAKNFNLHEYQNLTTAERYFALIVKCPVFIKLPLLYIWTSIGYEKEGL